MHCVAYLPRNRTEGMFGSPLRDPNNVSTQPCSDPRRKLLRSPRIAESTSRKLSGSPPHASKPCVHRYSFRGSGKLVSRRGAFGPKATGPHTRAPDKCTLRTPGDCKQSLRASGKNPVGIFEFAATIDRIAVPPQGSK